jgi:hypothetical protein
MRKLLIALALALAAGLPGTNLHADDAAPDNRNPNWFSFGPQFGLNLNARFKHIGNVNPASSGNYDDGFVQTDSSGNAGGQTWNWGYQNASQVQGDTLTMHGSSAAINAAENQSGNLGVGFDLAYGRRLGTALGGKWGLQAAFDFTTISIHDSHPISGTGALISDKYSLGGITAPQAPYAGSFNGPGPLLGDSPTRTMSSQTVLITGSRTLDAQIYALRLGPYFEFPFGRRWSGRLDGGLVLAVASTQYSFNETITYGNGQVVNNSGSSSGAEFNAGGFLEAKLLFALTRKTSLFAGAQYEHLGTFSQNTGNEQAQLDMSNTAYIRFGVELNF